MTPGIVPAAPFKGLYFSPHNLFLHGCKGPGQGLGKGPGTMLAPGGTRVSRTVNCWWPAMQETPNHRVSTVPSDHGEVSEDGKQGCESGCGNAHEGPSEQVISEFGGNPA